MFWNSALANIKDSNWFPVFRPIEAERKTEYFSDLVFRWIETKAPLNEQTTSVRTCLCFRDQYLSELGIERREPSQQKVRNQIMMIKRQKMRIHYNKNQSPVFWSLIARLVVFCLYDVASGSCLVFLVFQVIYVMNIFGIAHIHTPARTVYIYDTKEMAACAPPMGLYWQPPAAINLPSL